MPGMRHEKSEILRFLLQMQSGDMKMLQKREKIVYNVLIFVAYMRYNRYE